MSTNPTSNPVSDASISVSPIGRSSDTVDPSAIASGDFTNIATNNAADGVYTINGETVLITEIIDLLHPENNFDPILDIDTGGIKTRFNVGPNTYTTRTIAINSPLLDTLLADGFTLLLEMSTVDTVSLSTSVHDDAFNLDVGGSAVNDPGGPATYTQVGDKDFNSTSDNVNYPILGQINKFAITVASDRVAGSINGNAVIVTPGGGLDPTLANIVMGFSGVANDRFRSFAFYEVVADADLPSLSAL